MGSTHLSICLSVLFALYFRNLHERSDLRVGALALIVCAVSPESPVLTPLPPLVAPSGKRSPVEVPPSRSETGRSEGLWGRSRGGVHGNSSLKITASLYDILQIAKDGEKCGP